jgi:hypothetical protein
LNAEKWHYMPVLKIKRGEVKALAMVAGAHRPRILPLMEVVERKVEKTVEEHLDTAFRGFADGLRSYERCLLDAREIAQDGPAAAEAVFDRAEGAGLVFSPVTGVSRSADVAPALAHIGNGLALRVTRREFEEGGIAGRIDGFLTNHALTPAAVDLILDFGALDGFVSEGVANLAEEFLAEVPSHTAWRTLTVVGSAFPKSMGIVDKNGHAIIERADWRAWRDSIHARRHGVARLPDYGDCAIQHPSGVEGFDPKTMQASAVVRYTLAEDWLLIKGVGTRSTPPSTQFPQLARRLISGDLKAYFAGVSHCAGCRGISDAADGAPRLGSPEVWRRLGTIHHITTTVQGLAALPWI